MASDLISITEELAEALCALQAGTEIFATIHQLA
jgi:hypothetical protein